MKKKICMLLCALMLSIVPVSIPNAAETTKTTVSKSIVDLQNIIGPGDPPIMMIIENVVGPGDPPIM